jgi:hypothetical protein
VLLRKILAVDGGRWARGHHLEGGVSDRDGQTERKVEHAALTTVLQACAGQTDVGPLRPRGPIGLPAEDGERSGADLAFGSVIFLQHLNVRVVGEAVFAAGREICGFPPRTVEILFDLGWRHDGGSVGGVRKVVMRDIVETNVVEK